MHIPGMEAVMDENDIEKLKCRIDFLDLSEIKMEATDSNIIIWAPNGTGKSQLTGAIKELYSSTCMFADTEESRISFQKFRKNLIISPNAQMIDMLQNKIESLVKKMDIKAKLKRLGIANRADAAAAFPKHGECTVNQEIVLDIFNEDGANKVLDAVGAEDLPFYVKNRSTFRLIGKLKNDAYDLKERYIQTALGYLEKSVDRDARECPVCGAEHQEPVLIKIRDRIRRLEDTQETMLSEYSRLHPDMTVDEVEGRIDQLAKIEVSDEAVLSAAIVDGGQEDVAGVANLANEYKGLVEQACALNEIRKAGYGSLKKSVPRLQTLFHTAFQVDKDIKCDDESLSIVITMPRNVTTYSSGEINLMQTIITLAKYQASDRSMLIFDDPLSSLDKENQYATMFELVLAAREPGKRVIVFTHNMDCISVARSQCKNIYKFMVMEKLEGKLYINDLPSDLFDAPKESFVAGRVPASGALCADLLLSYGELDSRRKAGSHAEFEKCLAYIDAAVTRESDGVKDGEAAADPVVNKHELVHYRQSYCDGEGHSNDILVQDIENFSDSVIDMDDFVLRSIQKIYYLIALRVWVEKRIYEEFPELNDGKPHEIGGLIQLVGDRWERGRCSSGQPGPSRQYLNSIKVMLNQNVHGLAQSAPFDYAVNLSCDRLCRKIREIKRKIGERE